MDAYISLLFFSDMPGKADSLDAMFLRGRIVGMYDCGKSLSEISRRLGISRYAVRRWVQRWEEGEPIRAKNRSGRPRCTSDEENRQIVETARNHPITSAVCITQELRLTCSGDTTRRRLKEADLRCYTPAQKEALTDIQKATRMGFALEHLSKDEDFWRTCIFTDEKVFSTVEAGQRHCWRQKNTRYEAENIAEKRTCGRRTVSFWGWMWAEGPGELVKIDGRFNGQQYVEILEEVLLPSVRAMAIPHPMTIKLVHDNSSIHKCNLVSEWLEQHPEIVVIDWPTKGCDLNPIEHLWAAMCHEWSVGDQRTANAVEATAREVWESIRRGQLCSKLVNSIPNRLNEIIDANGGWTKY